MKQNNINLKSTHTALTVEEKEIWQKQENEKFGLILLAEFVSRACTWWLKIRIVENDLIFLETSLAALAEFPEGQSQWMNCQSHLIGVCQSLRDYLSCDSSFEGLYQEDRNKLEEIILKTKTLNITNKLPKFQVHLLQL